ncbi:MAG: inositol monophosphatase [Candidatus Limnocylindria bacterium]
MARHAAAIAVDVGKAIDTAAVEIVTRKGGRTNFATASDHAAEREILRRLRDLDGSVPILAEESARDELRRAERLWVVDPIDGTLNFAHGVPFYCVAIGYVQEGRVRASAIHGPRLRETFVASEGTGARLNRVPISVSSVVRARDAFVVSSLSRGAAGKLDSRFTQLNRTCARLRVTGSAALEIAYVAAGRFDLFVHEQLSPWDIAAPGLVAREAGAAVLSLATGLDAAWDEPRVIIGNPALVKDAIASMDLIREK